MEANGRVDQALTVIRDSWPFLVKVRRLQIRHDRLAGRNLQESLDIFIRDGLDLMLLSLCSSGKGTVKNLKLKQRIDRLNPSAGLKILATVQMLANSFKENFDNFLLKAEVSYERAT